VEKQSVDIIGSANRDVIVNWVDTKLTETNTCVTMCLIASDWQAIGRVCY